MTDHTTSFDAGNPANPTLASAESDVPPLAQLLLEIEGYVATAGWDGAPRLFALVSNGDLRATDAQMAAELGISEDEGLTPIEQEGIPTERPIDDFLRELAWPPAVAGVALTIERLVLPPTAEEDIAGAEDPVAAALEHPEREDVRMAVAVLRDGARMCALRMRSHDADTERLYGEDLVPRLVDALAATLHEDEPDNEAGIAE